MGFDGDAWVEGMVGELSRSGRGLAEAHWIDRVSRGEATPEDMVGWARQHYWGVTYHTRRFLSIWLGRVPYEMTEEIIENVAEEVIGTASGSGKSHLHWLFNFTRALGAPDEAITEATANVEAVLCESYLFNLAHQRPWYEMIFGAMLGIEHQIPDAYTRLVEGFRRHYGGVVSDDAMQFFTIHIEVDEEHGGGIGELAQRYLDTEEKRRSARGAFFAGAEACRRCWDAYQGVSWRQAVGSGAAGVAV